MKKIEFLKAVPIIVAGHGGIHKGHYVTAGKRSPHWSDNTQVFEGISNSSLSNKLRGRMLEEYLECVEIQYDNYDLSLKHRVDMINDLYSKDNRMWSLALHHNAQDMSNVPEKDVYVDEDGNKGFYDNSEYEARGIEIYTSIGQTKSDLYADVIYRAIAPVATRYGLPMRSQKWKDGDVDYEANFSVLALTHCPSVLIETGFMTSHSDCRIILDRDFRDSFVESLIEAIKRINNYEKN